LLREFKPCLPSALIKPLLPCILDGINQLAYDILISLVWDVILSLKFVSIAFCVQFQSDENEINFKNKYHKVLAQFNQRVYGEDFYSLLPYPYPFEDRLAYRVQAIACPLY